MKKPTILKIVLFALIFLQSIVSHSQKDQNFKSFEPRYDNKNLRGDILLIGNSILNRDTRDRWGNGEGPSVPYDKKGQNGNFTMNYVNVDGGPGIFNSSSAKLDLPNPTCSKIVYVGLYWSAVTRGADPIDKVKFKMPGGSYINIEGTVIYDAKNNKVGSSLPYASYANVTDYFTKATPLPNPTGSYSVANVSTAEGSNKENGLNTGLSAGWSLFFVYENATLPEKAITSFDGFSAIDKDNNLDIKVSGFTTIPVGRVKAKFAFSAIEGDADIQGDFLAINGVKSIPPERPLELGDPGWIWNGQKYVWGRETKDNFFNSSVTSLGTVLNNRTPNSANTLGFDAGVYEIDNPPTKEFPGGSIIKNGDTSATISLGSNQDVYFYYFNAFAVEIIAPRIVLLKKVIGTDENGKDYDASNKDIGIDKDLRYEIGFQNKGNDDAVNFTITDILPNNIIFDETKDILPLPAGVTVASYNKATRTIVFNIIPGLVKAKGGIYTIKFRVKTIKDCESLTDACSNAIKNTAISKYNGVINSANFGEGSLAAEEGCNVGVPTATNFLIGLDKCKFEQTLFLCGSVILKAGGGYKTYVWTDDKGVVFGGNNQEVTVTKPGTYTVVTSATPPCLGIQQKFIVKDYSVDINDNPVNSYADNIDPDTNLPYICNNDGKPFPKIFLCGKTATKFIDTKISGASSIVWQETKDIPSSVLSDRCPDVEAKNWTEVGVGPTYTANKAGTFRLVVTYNNTCFNIYYFNVTQSVVDPTFIKEDIICDTKGSITITNPKPNDGHGYEYSLDGKEPYQASNVFNDVAAGRYLVHIRTKSVDNKFEKCIYTADVTISKLTFSTKVETTDPYCNGKTGTIKATATGVRGWYQFTVKDAITGALKGDSGQIADPKNFHLFEGIAPGTYNVEITSKDGCKETEKVTINDFSLVATATITKSLTCEEGEITVVATGGKPVAGVPPYYYYYVNGAKIPLTDPVIRINKAGDYSIVVIDDSGCSVTIPTITVPDIIRPTATIDKKDINCYGSDTGEISITLNPTNSAYTVSYSINGLAGPFSTINPIKGLAPGDYDVVVKYTYDKVDCFDELKKITIGGVASALTASAGIAELAGCGLPGNEKQGKVRITNAQGGKPFPAPKPYLYSFDGGNTWQDSNEAYINPSTTPYTFYIKDAADCIFPMEGIILEKKPDDPTIEVSTPTFNCDGSASTTVTVTNTGGANYEYEYLLNGVVNTNNPPNIFLNVPPSDKRPGGFHEISVRYRLISVPTFSSLLKEDFGTNANINSPDTQSPGINPAFCWERQVEATKCNGNKLFANGEYTVTNSLKNNPYDGWHNPVDHTKGSPLGKYLAVDAGKVIPNNAVLYRKTIKDIIKNQPIQVRFFATNLLKIGNNQPDASLTVELQNSAGASLSSQSTGKIPKTNGWVEYNRTINPGDNTTLDFVLRLEVSQENGIDFAVDDIEVYQLPKSCLTTKNFKVVVDPNKIFTAEVKNIIDTKCNGSKDGSLTIIASNFDTTNGFEYSIDKGINWINSKTQETIVSGLSEGAQDIRVRYSKDVTGCNFNFTPTIGSPAVFVVDATATVATCSEGATVTASAKGGTPGYIFTLTDKATPPNVTTFLSNGILFKVAPGTYTVSGVDANGCSDNKDTDLIIAAPVAPVATIKQNTGLCFDATKATLTVDIKDGVAPYFYQVKYGTGNYGDKIPVPAPATSFTYDATATGDYTFLITDSFGCTATAVSQKINALLTADALTTSSLTCIDPKEAVIEVTIKGGTTPFSYIVKNSAGNQVASVGPIAGPKFTYNTKIAGKYTFEITDKNKCTTTAEGNVAAITDPVVTATPTNPKCNGESNGSVTLLGSLGSGGYKYRFDSTVFTDKTIYTGLKAGVKYSYQIMDSKGCISIEQFITLSEPLVITPSASITKPYTCISGATITASATGGNGTTYTYELKITKGGVTTTIATNATGIFKDLTVAGDYSVTITDSKGCNVTKAAGTIVKLDPPTGMTLTPSALECPSNEVDVTISAVIGGTGTKSYAITAPADAKSNVTGAISGIFLGLAPDITYTFQVKDANNCTFEKSITIDPLPEIFISSKVDTEIQCFGDSKGSAIFTVSGFGNNKPYSYKIGTITGTGTTPNSGSSFEIKVPGLGAGTHTITVKNTTTKCEKSADVTIAGPTAVLEIDPAVTTGVTCLSKGTAVINVKGGWGSYVYTVTQTLPVAGLPIIQTDKTFINLVAGTYSVLVNDLKGCQVSQTIVIDGIVPIDAEIDLVDSDFCYGAAGATIKVTPNTKLNYVYSINGSTTTQDNGIFTGLIPGTYTIVVKDIVTGCFKNLTATTIASPITATIGLDKELDCDPTNPNAIIKVNIEKGYPNYKYRVNNTGAPFNGGYTDVGAGLSSFTHPTNTGSVAATYYFEITDSKGCITVVKQDIVAKVLPKAEATPSNPSCFGSSTGSVVVKGTLGVGPYTYYVSNDDITFTLMTSNVYANAGAGTYYFKVIDTKKCESASIKVTLVDPPLLVVSAVATNLTCGANNISKSALITVTASGGTPMTGTDKYWYSYDGGTTYIKSNTFPVSTAQNVSIKVKDDNGCTIETSVLIKPLTPPSPLSFVQKRPITCKTNENVSDLEVSFTDGLAPFKYEITAPTSVAVSVPGILTNTFTFTNLAPGTYHFRVTDVNGCTIIGSHEILDVAPIQVTGKVKTAVSCNTVLDGKIEFTVSGNKGLDYDYVLVGSASGTIAGGVKTGDVIVYSGLKGGEKYTLTVTNKDTGCKASFGVVLDEPTTITFVDVTATKVFCSKVETTITVEATGGTAPLTYAVVKKGITPTLGSYTTNTVFTKDTSVDGLFYDVYVVDKNGCPSMKSIQVVRDTAPTIDPITTPLCYSGTAITVTITGTVYDTDPAAIKLYGIDGVYNTNPIKTIPGHGTYVLSIKDANGCEAKMTVIVGKQLAISASLDKDITCAVMPPFTTTDALINVTADGGNGTYTYSYSNDNKLNWTDFTGTVFQTATTGDYYFRITSNGCSVETKVPVKVTPTVNPSITNLVATEVKCVGDEQSVLTITYDKTLGLAPYTFNVKNNTTGKDYLELTTGLAAGDYTITITDARGCTDKKDINIAAPKPIVIKYHTVNITCVDDGLGNANSVTSMGSIIIDKITDGISTVGGSGGKGPYNYFVTGANGYNEKELNNDGTTSVKFNIVDFGLYEIRVVDANGCSQEVPNVLVASIVTDLDIDIKTTASCDPAIGGTAVVKVGSTLSGVGPYHFAIYTGPGMKYPTVGDWQDETMPKGTTFTKLVPGVTYTFVIYDEGSKCYYYQTADKPIPTNSTLKITTPEIQNISCKGNADGKVSFVISTTYGVAIPVKYQIFNAQSLVAIGPEVSATVPATAPFLTVTSFGALPFGNYFILVKEDVGAPNAGCSIASLPFDIVESGFALELTASVTKNSNTCVTKAGIITAIAKFGTANATTPYLYQIFPDTGDVGVLDGTDQKLLFPYDASHIAFSATFDLASHKSNVFHKDAGNYIVYVKDAYGCIKEAFVTLKDDAAPKITAPTAICFDDLPTTVTVSGTVFTGSSITYSIGKGLPTVAVAGAYQTTPDFQIGTPGEYTFFVKDDNKCVAKVGFTVNDQILTDLQVTEELSCNGNPNATIHGIVSGGLGAAYTYKVKFDTGIFGAIIPIVGTTFDYSAADPGVYTFLITDGNCEITKEITVNDKVPTVFKTTVVDVQCNSGNSGSIIVNVTSGSGKFQYKLDGPISRPYQDSNIFDLLRAGTNYIVTVKDIKSCETVSTAIIVKEPVPLVVVAPIIVPLKCGVGNVAQSATVTLGASGGSAPYQYSFNNGDFGTETVYTVDDTGLTQTIPYSIMDKYGCSVSSTVTIDKLITPSAFVLAQLAPITCDAPRTTITISNVTGRPGANYSYATIAPSPVLVTNLTGSFPNLLPGDYVFEVTDIDYGCTYQEEYTIKEVVKIEATVESTVDISCLGTPDGKATLLVSGFGTGVTYTYIVNGGIPETTTDAEINLANLAAGHYTVEFKDNGTGCVTTADFDIDAPALALKSANVVTPLGCTTTGAVKMTAEEGWGSYKYTLTSPAGIITTNNDGIFEGLTEVGQYTTSVKDAKGCSIDDSFRLTDPVKPVATIEISSDYCYVGTNSTTLVVKATSTAPHAVTPYTYSINNGQTWQISDTFSDLAPGDYNAMVKDAFGCISVASATTIKEQLFATALNIKELSCLVGDTNGTIRVTPTGGYAPYTYKVKINTGTYLSIATTTATYTDYPVLASGNYQFLVTDARGCEYETGVVNMKAPTPVDFILTPKAPNCLVTPGNISNGTITVTMAASNDNPPYTYVLERVPSVAGTEITQDTGLFTGLPVGKYTVTVTSGRGCPVMKTTEILAPAAVNAFAVQSAFVCTTGNNPKTTEVTVTGTGGTGTGFKFSEDNVEYFDSNVFYVVADVAKTLKYYVKDSNGCVAFHEITIPAFPSLIAADVIFGDLMDCVNNKQVMNVAITGGTNTPEKFTYQVYKNGLPYGPLETVDVRDFVFNAPDADSNYQFEIFDNNTTCSIKSQIQIVPKFNTIKVIANASAPALCFGDANGTITIDVTGYVGNYSYEVFDGLVSKATGAANTATGSVIITGLAAGNNYTVVVKATDYPLCSTTSNVVEITQPDEKLTIETITNVPKNCNTTGAVVTVTSVKGGTPDYKYAFVEDGLSPAGKYTDVNTATLNPAVNTKWDVWVIDKNGCPIKESIVIGTDPVPFDIEATVATQCFDLLTNEEYIIDVIAKGVGPFEYSLDGINFQASPLIVKTPGMHDVYAKDANGCIVKATTGFTILDPLGLSAEITTYPTCNDDKGVITLTGSGGTISTPSSYQYTIGTVGGTFGTSNVFGGLSPGTHTFWIKDMITGCFTSITKEIPTATAVTDITLTPTHISCNGGTDGSITVTLATSNNNPDYKYSLVGAKGLIRGVQASPLFKDLPADSYTVTVISGRGCEGLATIVVKEPNPISITSVAVTDFACTANTNASNLATIVVTATGGTLDNDGNYKYVFIKKGATPADDKIVQSKTDNSYTEYGLTGGDYSIIVSDKNNCSVSTTAVIKPFMSIDDIVITVVDVITCTNNGQNIKVVPTTTGIGALPAFVYSITDVNGNVTTDPTGAGVFNNLPVGEYIITVFNPDTKCSLQRPHRVYEPNTFELVASNVNSITCYGAANGKITFTLVDSKGTPSVLLNGFDYVITSPVLLTPLKATSPNLGPLTIDNLKAGLYKISATLKDSPFCTVDAEFTIAGPISALKLYVQHTAITCAANNNGLIEASASGGWPGGYEYQLELKSAPGVAVGPWSWSANSIFRDLTAGDYVVKVRDTGKCEVSDDMPLVIPTPITATITADKLELTCFGDNGATITVNSVSGGSGKYLYTLEATYPDGVVTNNGPQESNVFTNLKSGSYKVIVSDDWKCTGESNIIEIKDPIKVEASVDIKTIEGCDRFPVVTLSATGGTGPYKYGIDGINFSTTTFGTSIDITLPATAVVTRYEYYVQDALGCISDVTTVSFSPVPKLVFTNVDVYDIHCKGSSSGSIYVTAVGGLGNYVYTLLDSGKNIVTARQDKPGQFDDLAAGDYFVQVNSDDCENISLPVTIIEPTTSVDAKAVPTDLTCNSSGNGKITVIAEGGTGVLRYAISPDFRQFFESNVFDNLDPGLYTIIVQDENGCEVVIENVEVKEPPILDVSLVPGSILPEYCEGDKDGAFKVKITGGTAPYRVILDNRDGTYEQILADEHTFIELVGGTHIVYIKDANDCSAEVEILTPDAVKLDPIAKINTDCVDNFGANFVTITVDESNTNPLDMKYALDGNTIYQDSNIFVNVAPGSHTVTVLHSNGCEKTTLPFTIDVVQPLTLTLADGGLNEIVATATGGGGEYQYTLDGEPYGSVNKFIIYKSGTYTVTVTDKNGCTATATRYFEYIDVCIPNHFTPNGDGINDTWAPGCTVNYKDLTFDIFDRYGRVICKYRLGQKWDGRYNGNELPSGDYWYVLKLNDKKDDREFVGHFTLYR
ncbi:T9SS type B sorting domain-containing protein [Flavobacterium sp. EDS]|uniref:T9SS type B sorting domain-containing protein n=1 Tax=Flavobacterium sp. EDS TaxID=2897328 RepID=UPI001E4A3102|nr:T9SS type B sorting domain-containing protein [Flavobacterium sp. EDS]MCD0474213.1 T9SS type B sorting domain-containing protein [Flavobacterium sp. EDS]